MRSPKRHDAVAVRVVERIDEDTTPRKAVTATVPASCSSWK